MFVGKDGRKTGLLEVAIYVLLKTNPVTRPEETPRIFCALCFGNSRP
jgi:hypothetical protein